MIDQRRRVRRQRQRAIGMFRFFASTIGIIFVIGLLVVIGLLALIF